MGDSSQTPYGGARLYARIWRWHFFAAFIVIPFVLWQAITGTVYLWHQELAALAHPRLLTVTPHGARVDYAQQLSTALAQQSGRPLQRIEIVDDPARSTTFFFSADNGLEYPAFVDPYSGRYLGSVESTHWLAGLSRALHGGWPIKPYGSYLLELGASWAIVMTLTGLYLWWPRNARGLAGVLYPRLRNGARVFWRDLHATVGVYFALIVLAFLITALPWTTFWGDSILKPIERATGQVSPFETMSGGGANHSHAAPTPAALASHRAHQSAAATVELSIDALIESARAAGATGAIEIVAGRAGEPVGVSSTRPRSSQVLLLQLDRATGTVLARAEWRDYPPLAKLVATGVDLHEGAFFGRANQIFNTVVAAALVWLSITGFIGWYKRRPHGGVAAPAKLPMRFPSALVASGVGLCVALPLLGASVFCIVVADRIFGRLLESRA